MSAIYKSEEGARAVEARYRELLARWPVPAEQRHVDTPHGTTFVVVCGPPSAPPVVMLQGSGANNAMWLPDIATLSNRHRLYCLDVIGEPGLSTRTRPLLASGVYREWLGEVLTGLGLPRASLVGVSLGGWIALEFAAAHPDRVESVVLIAPSGVGRQKVSFMFKAIAYMLLGGWGRRKAMQLAVGPAREHPDAVEIEVGRFALFVHAHFRSRRERVPMLTDVALEQLTMPVLALVGDRDALLDSAATKRRLERHASRATVRLLPHTGHVIRGHAADVAQFLSEDRASA